LGVSFRSAGLRFGGRREAKEWWFSDPLLRLLGWCVKGQVGVDQQGGGGFWGP
jgi:hypothetical protein